MLKVKSPAAAPGGYQGIKTASMLTAEVSKIVRKMGANRVYDALTDDEKMEGFAKDVYSQLPINLKSRISLEQLIPMIMQNKEKMMKSKNNKKKVRKKQQ